MKTVIVTGASRGIGAAIVRSLRARGCRVIGVARSLGPLESLKAEKIGAEFDYVAGDICETSVLERAVNLATENGSSLDGIVLNAGNVDPIERCVDIPMDQFRSAFEINMFSAVNLCKLAIPHLRKSQGRIIYTSTGVAESPMAAWSPYCSSKAAMNMYLKCLAQEEPGIVCLAVRPGIVDTEMVRGVYGNPRRAEVMEPDQFKFIKMQKEYGKLLKPEQPGDVMAKLALEAPKSLSGQFLAWDDAKIKKLFESA